MICEGVLYAAKQMARYQVGTIITILWDVWPDTELSRYRSSSALIVQRVPDAQWVLIFMTPI